MSAPLVLLVALTGVLCAAEPVCSSQQNARVLDLTTVPWTVTSSNVSVATRIPTQAHLDLLAAGIINEPTYGENDVEQLWIANSNFTYHSTILTGLTTSEDFTTYLVFDGLDTFANISFCGVYVGSVNNQFRQWTFDVSKALQGCSTPSVQVAFQSAPSVSTPLVEQAYDTQGVQCIPCYGTLYIFEGRQFIRKEQSDYGWDWAPGFAPQGIWQPARIVQVPREAPAVKIEILYLDVFRQGQINNLPPDQSAPWVVNASIDYFGNLPNDAAMYFKISDSSGEVFEQIQAKAVQREAGRITGSIVLSKQPQLWWPVGHGNQSLYNITVELQANGSSTPLASAQKRTGFRTIVLNQTPVSPEQLAKGIAPGNNWHFEINGHEIYAKGSNIVPPDPFWPRVTKQYMDVLFTSALAANQNMLRVWASSAYFPDFAYDLADEYGLLLWSELQFSDAFYPSTADYIENYVKEVEYQVRRLNSHPSLALWAGGNELELALVLVEFAAPLNYPAALSNYQTIFLDALIHAVFDNTRSITYMPSSTNNGYLSYIYNRSMPIQERYGAMSGIESLYGDGDYYNYDVTQAFTLGSYPVSRFTNEFGFHSHSSYETYSAFVPANQLSFNSSVILHRNRHNTFQSITQQDPRPSPQNQSEVSLTGMGQMSQGATLYYPTANKQDPVEAFKLQIYATQLFQAEFIRSQIDFYRRGSGQRQRNLGSLYWQLNDIWAAPTWASVEIGGRWKLLHHLVSDAYAPVVIAPFIDDNGNISISVTSDLWDDIDGAASLTWYNWNGQQIHPGGNWSFAGKTVSVGAINSTQIWSNNLLSMPSVLIPAIGLLRVKVKSSGGTEYHSERYFVPQHLSSTDSIKAMEDPELSIQYDACEDCFTVTSKATAAFVWLAQPFDAKGYFTSNGFWMTPGSRKVRFKLFDPDGAPPEGWQKNVTITSIWDLTTT